jgi:hypothetical protein
MIDQEQIEELADRLTGDGFDALTANDWPILVLAMEALSDRRMNETVLDEARADLAAANLHAAKMDTLAHEYKRGTEQARAELAAEREDRANKDAAWCEQAAEDQAKIDKLREVLVKAQDVFGSIYEDASEVAAIDAVLKESGE